MTQKTEKLNSPAVPVRPRIQERLAVFLAFLAGYIDVVGYSKLKTYVSFMSGNTTNMGINISHGDLAAASAASMAITGFVTGIFIGSCIASARPQRSKTINTIIPAVLLTLYLLLEHYTKLAALPAVVIISMSTGVMNTIITIIGKQSVNTEFVTGTLNSIAKQFAGAAMAKDAITRNDHLTGGLYVLLLWMGFLTGAAVGVTATAQWGQLSLAAPMLLLLAAPFLWKGVYRAT